MNNNEEYSFDSDPNFSEYSSNYGKKLYDIEKNNEELNKEEDILLKRIFFEKYRPIKRIGQGGFSKIYKVEYKKEYFAMKLEQKNAQQPLLESEGKVMDYLKGPYVPLIKLYGQTGEFNALIMQLMGRDLDILFKKLRNFSIKTASMLAYEILKILEFIHDRHIIHRDIKPSNFVLGLEEENKNKIYMIDFGFAKKYRSNKTSEQYPMKKTNKLTGTARYASINALELNEQSRRDDLESLAYVLIYFIRGSLPWQGLKLKKGEERNMRILKKKKRTKSDELCWSFPNEFMEFLDYAKSLDYFQRPDYETYRKKFYELVLKIGKGNHFDYIYDWIPVENKESTDKVESTCCTM